MDKLVIVIVGTSDSDMQQEVASLDDIIDEKRLEKEKRLY